MLEALGINAYEEAVYRAVIRLGKAQMLDVSAAVGDSVPDVGAAVGRLEALGLVARNPDEYVVAVPPDLAIDALVAERETALQRSAVAARSIAQEFHAEHRERP